MKSHSIASHLTHGIDFVTIVSHQLRTPLTAIKWYVDVLLAGKAGELKHQQRDFLLDVYQSNERMIRLVDNLLIIEQLERRKLGMLPRRGSITSLIRNIVAEYDTYARANSIALITNLNDQNLPPVKLDTIYLRLALKNIIDNALRYTPKRGTVTVACEVVRTKHNGKESKAMQIAISDTGIGIPEEEKELVFHKFYRSAKSLTMQTEGTGLGLYIAKVIIEKHDGRIWFKPQFDGQPANAGQSDSSPALAESLSGQSGTTFYISLPLD